MKKLSNEAKFNLKLFAFILFFIGVFLLSCKEDNSIAPVIPKGFEYSFNIIYQTTNQAECGDCKLILNNSFVGYIKNGEYKTFEAVPGLNSYKIVLRYRDWSDNFTLNPKKKSYNYAVNCE